jgi:hypothetical protein
MGIYGWVLWAAVTAAAPTDSVGGTHASANDSADDSADVAEEPEGGLGVSPIELIPRLEVREAFQRLPNDVSFHDTTVEIDIQFLRRILLRYQLPYRVIETPKGQFAGAGDLQLAAIGILASTPTYLLGLIGGAVLDTATQPALGMGKQQVFFGGGAAGKPRRWSLAYGVVQEQLSVGGDSTRPDINQLALQLGDVLFGKQFNWLRVELDQTFDLPKATPRTFGTLEVGSLLVGRVAMFVRGGTQLIGQRELEYSVTGGVRYLFRLTTSRPAGQ